VKRQAAIPTLHCFTGIIHFLQSALLFRSLYSILNKVSSIAVSFLLYLQTVFPSNRKSEKFHGIESALLLSTGRENPAYDPRG
jgi:hypothetical protein